MAEKFPDALNIADNQMGYNLHTCLKRIQERNIRFTSMWDSYRRNSKGWEKDSPAQLHPRIMFGSKSIPITPSITHVINCASDEMSPGWFKSKYPERYVCLNAIDMCVSVHACGRMRMHVSVRAYLCASCS